MFLFHVSICSTCWKPKPRWYPKKVLRVPLALWGTSLVPSYSADEHQRWSVQFWSLVAEPETFCWLCFTSAPLMKIGMCIFLFCFLKLSISQCWEVLFRFVFWLRPAALFYFYSSSSDSGVHSIWWWDKHQHDPLLLSCSFGLLLSGTSVNHRVEAEQSTSEGKPEDIFPIKYDPVWLKLLFCATQ